MALQSRVGKVFSAFLGPSLSQSSDHNPRNPVPQQQPASSIPAASLHSVSVPANEANSSEVTTHLPESAVYSPGASRSAPAGQPQPAVPVLILPDLGAVLSWRQECVQQIASQCCVHESVAVLLLGAHQGSAESACEAWAHSPQGVLRQPTLALL